MKTDEKNYYQILNTIEKIICLEQSTGWRIYYKRDLLFNCKSIWTGLVRTRRINLASSLFGALEPQHRQSGPRGTSPEF